MDKLLNSFIGRLLAQDAGEKWITVNGGSKKDGDGGGAHVLVDGNGRIVAGMGGKFTGVKIDNVPRKKFINEKAYQRRQAGKNKNMDYTLPKRVDPSLIIQNRDRAGGGSKQQIMEIAASPDYDRLSVSRTLADGAPVVAYGTIPAKRLGRVETVTDAKGNKLNVQYAVMEAGDVAASHDAMGVRNKNFYGDDPNVTRAIAGNGRIAGLQRAYTIGTAGEYKNGLMDDDAHGIDVGEISRMKRPVLVRVMQPKDVTADIGDRSNTASNLTMTATETAKNDAHRIDMTNTATYADGSPTVDAVKDFIAKLPTSEQGAMIDADGYPTRQAQERLKAAMFAAAYNNQNLTRLASQAATPEAGRIIQGLQRSAGNVANIAKDYPKIRELIANSAERCVLASRTGKLSDAETAGDLFKNRSDDSAEGAILRVFTRSTSIPEIQGKIDAIAKGLKAEADKPDFDLFGANPKRAPADVIRTALADYESNKENKA